MLRDAQALSLADVCQPRPKSVARPVHALRAARHHIPNQQRQRHARRTPQDGMQLVPADVSRVGRVSFTGQVRSERISCHPLAMLRRRACLHKQAKSLSMAPPTDLRHRNCIHADPSDSVIFLFLLRATMALQGLLRGAASSHRLKSHAEASLSRFPCGRPSLCRA